MQAQSWCVISLRELMREIFLPWQNLICCSQEPHKPALEILPRVSLADRTGLVIQGARLSLYWCKGVSVPRCFLLPLWWDVPMSRVFPHLIAELQWNGERNWSFKTSPLPPFYLILNNSLVQFRALQSVLSKSGSEDSELLGDGECWGQSLAHPACTFTDASASLAGATAGSKWVT